MRLCGLCAGRTSGTAALLCDRYPVRSMLPRQRCYTARATVGFLWPEQRGRLRFMPVFPSGVPGRCLALPGPSVMRALRRRLARQANPLNEITGSAGSVNAASLDNAPGGRWPRLVITRTCLTLAALILGCVMLHGQPARAACDDPPPPVRDIIADRFYVDTASSVSDKAIIARNKNALATLDHTLNAIIAMEDKALAGDAASAACAGRWLVVWAKGGAMLGHMSSQQAVIERKWRTGGMAVGYLKIRASLPPADRAAINSWMNDLGDQVVADQGWPARRNNQLYWAGFAAGAVGIRHRGRSPDRVFPPSLRRRDDRYPAGRNAADGTRPPPAGARLHDVRPGAVGHERRTCRTARRGLVWSRERRDPPPRRARPGGITRSRRFCRAGAHETSVEVPRGGLLGWLAFYRLRFPDRVDGAPPGPYRYDWLGGDLTLTAKAWVKR